MSRERAGGTCWTGWAASACWALVLLLVGGAPLLAEETRPEDLEFFEKRIRPVLVEHCYGCHSADAARDGKLRGGLLLDGRQASRRGGESGPAVVPGKPDESLLIGALRHESFEMPPKGKLPDSVIADFVKWVERGAVDPRDDKPAPEAAGIDIAAGRAFWSLKPLRVATPPVDSSGWSRTEIDRFIRARQQQAGLHPNGLAPARILVRRAWFDLLGLPPTPDELESWVQRLGAPSAKTGPGTETGTGTGAGIGTETETGTTWNDQAWSELIDQLLANPHYGERWARHWMDVARFAESHGYEQDYDRPTAYHYRDFLIRAFNQDLPYDRFVRWQLAGDELAPDQPLAWMATGFLGAGAFPTQLTEAEFESARYDELDDMVATTGVAFLGLSVGCARCHDHKFDPIPSRDYYRLAACFTTAIRSERELDLAAEENASRRQAYQRKQAELRAELDRYERETLPERFRQWLRSHDPSAAESSAWQVLRGQVTSTGGSNYAEQEDGSYLATGDAPPKEVIVFQGTWAAGRIASIRLEALTHASLPHGGPGKAGNGNFALGDFLLEVGDQAGGRPQHRKLVRPRATHQQNSGTLSLAASIDDDPISGWAVDGQIGRDQAAVFDLESPLDLSPPPEGNQEVPFRVTLRFEHPNTRHAMGRFRVSVSGTAELAAEVGQPGPGPAVVDALARCKLDPDPESAAWKTALAWYRTTDSEWQKKSGELQAHEQAGPQLQLAKVLVTSEGLDHLPHHADGRGFPHFYPTTHVLRRGDVDQKIEVAEPGFLQVLMRDEYGPEHWRASPPEGEQRTSYRRASLADWLTDVEHGAGHLAARVMVNRLWQHHFGRGLVATPNDFGSSGQPPSHPELLDWLAADLVAGQWRLKRLHKQIMTSRVYLQSSDADEPRLAIDRENVLLWRRTPRRLEAEAIRDAMLRVAGQLDPTMYGPGTLDPNMRRRSVYFFIKRSRLIPMMMLFDWPEHLVSIGQRASTTIAPQALMFMNSPQCREYAQAFARRLPEKMPDAVREAYRLAFGRDPTSRERELAGDFLKGQAETYQAAGRSDAEHQARTDLCQALFSMNEFVYID